MSKDVDISRRYSPGRLSNINGFEERSYDVPSSSVFVLLSLDGSSSQRLRVDCTAEREA